MPLHLNRSHFEITPWTPLHALSSLLTILLTLPLLLLALLTTLLALSFLSTYALAVCSTALLSAWRAPNPPPLSESTVEKILASPRDVPSPGKTFVMPDGGRDRGVGFEKGRFWSWPPRRGGRRGGRRGL